MIHTNKLKIGNYVSAPHVGAMLVTSILSSKDRPTEGKVIGINVNDNLTFVYNGFQLSPIPVTGALLEQLGFERNQMGHNDFGIAAVYLKEGLEVNEYTPDENGFVEFGWDNGLGYTIDVHELHLLQNLFSTITNTDLIINENILNK